MGAKNGSTCKRGKRFAMFCPQRIPSLISSFFALVVGEANIPKTDGHFLGHLFLRGDGTGPGGGIVICSIYIQGGFRRLRQMGLKVSGILLPKRTEALKI